MATVDDLVDDLEIDLDRQARLHERFNGGQATIQDSELRAIEEQLLEDIRDVALGAVGILERGADDSVITAVATGLHDIPNARGPKTYKVDVFVRACDVVERARKDPEDPCCDGGWPDGDPCPECGELMDVGAVGNPGETITWQQCEDCGLGWGPFTGFVPLEEGSP